MAHNAILEIQRDLERSKRHRELFDRGVLSEKEIVAIKKRAISIQCTYAGINKINVDALSVEILCNMALETKQKQTDLMEYIESKRRVSLPVHFLT